MTDNKLTPRVGDRVIVSAGEIPGSRDALVIPTTTGSVDAVRGANVAVVVDAGPYNGPDRHWWFPFGRLTVVDREPVEWPDGWNKRPSRRVGAVTVPDGDYQPALSREAFDRIRGPEGDYVAEHWDELVGGES
jgi:hypothetical protein